MTVTLGGAHRSLISPTTWSRPATPPVSNPTRESQPDIFETGGGIRELIRALSTPVEAAPPLGDGQAKVRYATDESQLGHLGVEQRRVRGQATPISVEELRNALTLFRGLDSDVSKIQQLKKSARVGNPSGALAGEQWVGIEGLREVCRLARESGLPLTNSGVAAFKRSEQLTGGPTLGPTTAKVYFERLTSPPRLRRYEPGSPQAVGLFREAARLAEVPERWASSRALHNILRRESAGIVGRPNYTYGARATNQARWPAIHEELRRGVISAHSSATGLGQLLLSNVDRYYPKGRAGIGDALQEAAGMLRYIKDRYSSPERAWAQYGARHEGY
ncbi:MAG: hypothetical protein HY791_35530 [Deltaproteobacteria bacterium]|nr:hypothetical protein [Deltaproteobacteria bacterium]